MSEVILLFSPGTGPVHGAGARDADANIEAFCRELGLGPPSVRIERRSDGDYEGRYDYAVYRGIRTTKISMPGLPLDRVRLRRSDNAWDFPRLYVDGNSWLWPYAIETAREALVDHDGSRQQRYEESQRVAMREFSEAPRCPICGSIKERYIAHAPSDNPPYGLERLRCLVCTPIETTAILSAADAVFLDDSWKQRPYGHVYRVTTRRMPYEALGTPDDPICTIGYYGGRQCRLRRNHGGPCEPLAKEISRDRIDLPYRGDA